MKSFLQYISELNLATYAGAAGARRQRTIFNPTQKGVDQAAKNRIRLNRERKKLRSVPTDLMTVAKREREIQQGEQEGTAGEILKQRGGSSPGASKAYRFTNWKKKVQSGDDFVDHIRDIEARIRDSMIKQQKHKKA